jgi:hypothetical protein
MMRKGDLLQDIEDGSLALIVDIEWAEYYDSPIRYKLLFDNGYVMWLNAAIIQYYFEIISEGG